MESMTFENAKHEAFLNPDLMPSDCLDILINKYGKRLDRMNADTIKRMIYEMMSTATDYVDTEHIEEVVFDFIND